MQIKTILRILGLLLMLLSISMLPPIVIEGIFQDGAFSPFLIAFAITLFTGLALTASFYHEKKELKIRDGFLVVILFWTVLCLFASIPLFVAEQPHLSFTDALFEAISGFTTTGATVITDIEGLPHAMRYYRQQLQFLGGMGIVVLAVAILPMLGVGGMQLYRAEAPGPVKDSKLTPRITETAKTLWFIYVGLTILCGLCYWIVGMNWFDALGESFATISTGGFSMHTTSFSFYHSSAIELIAVVFMILGGTNFSLHFIALRQRSITRYWQDEEFCVYIYILLFTIILVASALIHYGVYQHNFDAIVKSIFNVVSVATTTGFISAPFSVWPTFIPILIMLTAIIGGCAASTSGGVKVMRVLLLEKQSSREVRRLIHPRSIATIKFNKQTLPEHISQSMWAFIAVFIGFFALLLLALMANGMNLETAFGATVATLSNAGVGLGNVAEHFKETDTVSKWILMVAMLAGRLEIFTLLVIFTPAYWRN